MKLNHLGFYALIVFAITCVVLGVHFGKQNVRQIAEILPTDTLPERCPVHTIDTVYNFITGVGEDSMDTDRLRDSVGCIVSQEVVNFVYWEPVIEHSEIK